MELTRRQFGKHSLLALATATLAPAALFMTSCSTSVIAGLINTLGGAAASIASALGDSALSETITTYTASVVTAVNNWKAGTGTAADVVAILNVLLANINLIPVSPLYQMLISLAITTVESLLTIFGAGTAAAMKSAYDKAVLAGAPQDKAAFKSRWNNICAGDSRLASVVIK